MPNSRLTVYRKARVRSVRGSPVKDAGETRAWRNWTARG